MKKFTKVALAAGLAVSLSSAAFAGGYSRAEAATMPHPCGVHGLGVSIASPFSVGVADFLEQYRFGLNYVVQSWEMGLDFNGGHTDNVAGEPDSNRYRVGLHAGYRWPLFHCLFGSIGGLFAWEHFHNVQSSIGTATETSNLYTAGAYLGLSWEPTEHIQLFGRAHAVTYTWGRNETTRTDGPRTWNFFNEGEFGVAYYFGDVV